MSRYRPPRRLPWYARVPAARWRWQHGIVCPRTRDTFYGLQKRRNAERKAARLAAENKHPDTVVLPKRAPKKRFDIEGIAMGFVMFGMGCMCLALVILLVLDALAKTDLVPCLRTVFEHP